MNPRKRFLIKTVCIIAVMSFALSEVAAQTTLYIYINVYGFEIWVDGMYEFTTPPDKNWGWFMYIPPGTHTITLKKAGCADASAVVNIIAGVQNQVTINMSCSPVDQSSGDQSSDTDADGVPDNQDGCYNPGCTAVDSNGCPRDTDRDGTNDCEDRCPAEAGSPANDGCPASDSDNDGVTDDQDTCYNPECDIVDAQGCPKDSDNDGVTDCEDRCPSEYGERRNDGCPAGDSDNDGVTDDQDDCYNPGCTLVDSRGCPWDSDGDGLTDCEDNCPSQTGPRSNYGCPESEQGPQFCLGTALLGIMIVGGILVVARRK